MSDPDQYPVPDEWARRTRVDAAGYERLYGRSLADPGSFWLEKARRLDWIKRPEIAGDWSFDKADFHINWFADGRLNVAANCLDRHLAKRGDQVALLWEPDEPGDEPRRFTYRQLHAEVCRFANVLKAQGVARGDRVTLHLPMIPHAVFAMLACARIGAVHVVVSAGCAPDALAERIADCGSRIVVTADEGRCGGARTALKANVDAAATRAPSLERVIVVRATGGAVAIGARDVWYHDAAAGLATTCPPEPMGAEDPLFILYADGSTARPAGMVHTSGGYLLWAGLTHEWCFDYRPGDLFWCAADLGGMAGHSYGLYGPLANGATLLLYEGRPDWPDASRLWQVVDRHRVHTLVTAPSVLRALMVEGDAPVAATSRASLRLLGTVGAPIDPATWRWYRDTVGGGRCPVVATWGQAETGGAMIAPLPGAITLKPGSATTPLPGVRPQLVDDAGAVLAGAAHGRLCVAASWPGQMRGIWGDRDRFFRSGFTTCPGRYFTGSDCRRDDDGYYWPGPADEPVAYRSA